MAQQQKRSSTTITPGMQKRKSNETAKLRNFRKSMKNLPVEVNGETIVWRCGCPVKIYSQSLRRWCPGEISDISQDAEGYCLDVRYWTKTNVPKAKFLDPESPHLKKLYSNKDNNHIKTRYEWDKGDEVECFSNSQQTWFKANIVDIISYDEESDDYLKLQWCIKNDEFMSKELQRSSIWVRHRYPSLTEEINPNDIIMTNNNSNNNNNDSIKDDINNSYLQGIIGNSNHETYNQDVSRIITSKIKTHDPSIPPPGYQGYHENKEEQLDMELEHEFEDSDADDSSTGDDDDDDDDSGSITDSNENENEIILKKHRPMTSITQIDEGNNIDNNNNNNNDNDIMDSDDENEGNNDINDVNDFKFKMGMLQQDLDEERDATKRLLKEVELQKIKIDQLMDENIKFKKILKHKNIDYKKEISINDNNGNILMNKNNSVPSVNESNINNIIGIHNYSTNNSRKKAKHQYSQSYSSLGSDLEERNTMQTETQTIIDEFTNLKLKKFEDENKSLKNELNKKDIIIESKNKIIDTKKHDFKCLKRQLSELKNIEVDKTTELYREKVRKLTNQNVELHRKNEELLNKNKLLTMNFEDIKDELKIQKQYVGKFRNQCDRARTNLDTIMQYIGYNFSLQNHNERAYLNDIKRSVMRANQLLNDVVTGTHKINKANINIYNNKNKNNNNNEILNNKTRQRHPIKRNTSRDQNNGPPIGPKSQPINKKIKVNNNNNEYIMNEVQKRPSISYEVVNNNNDNNNNNSNNNRQNWIPISQHLDIKWPKRNSGIFKSQYTKTKIDINLNEIKLKSSSNKTVIRRNDIKKIDRSGQYVSLTMTNNISKYKLKCDDHQLAKDWENIFNDWLSRD